MFEKSPRDQTLSVSRWKLAFIVFAIVAGFFLIAEHRAHVVPYLPWLLLAACPLVHLLMHHGHGEHDNGRIGRGSRAGSNGEHPSHERSDALRSTRLAAGGDEQ